MLPPWRSNERGCSWFTKIIVWSKNTAYLCQMGYDGNYKREYYSYDEESKILTLTFYGWGNRFDSNVSVTAIAHT